MIQSCSSRTTRGRCGTRSRCRRRRRPRWTPSRSTCTRARAAAAARSTTRPSASSRTRGWEWPIDRRRGERREMRGMRAWAMAVAVAVAIAAAAAPASAGPVSDQLKDAVDRVIKLLEDPALKGPDKTGERRAGVTKIAQEIFDFPEVARRSLARHWQPLTDKQREEFTTLFADLLERSYVSKIELYSGEKITYGNERLDGETAVVPTRIASKSGAEIPIDYRMQKKGVRWL